MNASAFAAVLPSSGCPYSLRCLCLFPPPPPPPPLIFCSFEVLTLMQTGKIEHPDVLPVVLFPGSYWKRCINWQEFVDAGVVAPADVDQLKVRRRGN